MNSCLDMAQNGKFSKTCAHHIFLGSVNVEVEYSVILLRPFRNEVLDTIVTMASDENGFFCKLGPLQIFVSFRRMTVYGCLNPYLYIPVCTLTSAWKVTVIHAASTYYRTGESALYAGGRVLQQHSWGLLGQ